MTGHRGHVAAAVAALAVLSRKPSRVAGHEPPYPPGQAGHGEPLRGTPPPPPGGGPAAAPPPVLLSDQQARSLGQVARWRIAAAPQAVANGHMVADGLRRRLPHLSDAELGVLTCELWEWTLAAAHAATDAGWAFNCVSNAFGLAAEELTRLDRMEAPL